MAEALGVLGALIIALAAIYYVWDIARGDTRPHRVSWGAWTVIGVLGYGTATEGGAGPGAYAAGIYLIAQFVTFGLSLLPCYGKPGGRWYDRPLGAARVVGRRRRQCARRRGSGRLELRGGRLPGLSAGDVLAGRGILIVRSRAREPAVE